MIKFKTVRWKNLLSTGNNFTEICLDGTHTTILLGQSGSGKSTLLDAIAFSLFNRPFRNINKNQLINSINQKNCLVEIEFVIGTQEYIVRRGIKPSVFEIVCNGVLVNQDSHTKDYQQYLERQILKFNFKSFCQIVVLGASNFTPFMQLKTSDRRTIIEGLLDIEIFSVMNSLLKQKISSTKTASQDNEYAISLTKEKITMQQKYLLELAKNTEDKIKENQETIRKNREQMTALQEENNNYKSQISELSEKLTFKKELVQQIDNIKSIQSKLDNNISKTNKEVCFLHDNSSCPTCAQKIDEQFKVVEIQKKEVKIAEWNSGIVDAQTALMKLVARLEEYKQVEDTIDKLKYQIGKNQSVVDGIVQFISKIETEVEALQTQPTASKEQTNELTQLEDQLKSFETNRQDFSVTKNIQEMAVALLKDNGVKAHIIKQYLPLINKHTNIFLNTMNFFVSFDMNEEFVESIKSRGRDAFSYENFSEGEKQRIDLALLFTWRTIAKMKNSINTNLLIMDEVLDSYLDATATENVLHLLNSEMFKDTNIFVISHKDTIADKFQKTIKFTKSKNFSTIE